MWSIQTPVDNKKNTTRVDWTQIQIKSSVPRTVNFCFSLKKKKQQNEYHFNEGCLNAFVSTPKKLILPVLAKSSS